MKKPKTKKKKIIIISIVSLISLILIAGWAFFYPYKPWGLELINNS